jgi:hypothetical protein
VVKVGKEEETPQQQATLIIEPSEVRADTLTPVKLTAKPGPDAAGLNGAYYEWDFGDGFISNEIHPTHAYMASGSFQVVLKAFSRLWTRSPIFMSSAAPETKSSVDLLNFLLPPSSQITIPTAKNRPVSSLIPHL